jgi:hypothetical protein
VFATSDFVLNISYLYVNYVQTKKTKKTPKNKARALFAIDRIANTESHVQLKAYLIIKNISKD